MKHHGYLFPTIPVLKTSLLLKQLRIAVIIYHHNLFLFCFIAPQKGMSMFAKAESIPLSVNIKKLTSFQPTMDDMIVTFVNRGSILWVLGRGMSIAETQLIH